MDEFHGSLRECILKDNLPNALADLPSWLCTIASPQHVEGFTSARSDTRSFE